MSNRYFRLLAVVCASVLILSGCATMEGFGKDVEKLGDEIQEAADK